MFVLGALSRRIRRYLLYSRRRRAEHNYPCIRFSLLCEAFYALPVSCVPQCWCSKLKNSDASRLRLAIGACHTHELPFFRRHREAIRASVLRSARPRDDGNSDISRQWVPYPLSENARRNTPLTKPDVLRSGNKEETCFHFISCLFPLHDRK
jgi:hypothetical protein